MIEQIPHLQRISKPSQPLNHLPPSLSALIRTLKLPHHTRRNHDRQSRSNNRRINTGSITRLILRSKHCTSHNPSNPTRSHESRARKRAFPLSTNVVGLEGENGRDIRIARSSGEKDSKVARSGVGGESQERKTDETEDGVEDDDGAAEVVFVSVPGTAVL